MTNVKDIIREATVLYVEQSTNNVATGTTGLRYVGLYDDPQLVDTHYHANSKVIKLEIQAL